MNERIASTACHLAMLALLSALVSTYLPQGRDYVERALIGQVSRGIR